MLGYALRRLVLAIPLLIGITLISFSVIHLAPGEPAELGTGDTPIQSDREVRERLIQMYGLDKPLHVQYWNWLTR
ncbi:MAG: diguanylate cyclase, partial [Candidatus Rokuibacteriota bacterium]